MNTTDVIGLSFDESSLAATPLVTAHRPLSATLDVPANLDPIVREAAIIGWQERARSEYMGVMIVRHFHGLLVDLNAPMDMQEIALVMLLQEQRHTALCMSAVRALGGDSELPFELGELALQRTDDPIAHQLLDMVVTTYCVGEVTALGLLIHSIRTLPNNGFRSILSKIAHDEGLHAKIGPAMLGAMRDDGWFPWPGEHAVRSLADQGIKQMKNRSVIDESEAELFQNPTYAIQLPQVGIPDSRSFKRAYFDSLENMVPQALNRVGLTL